MFNQSVLLMHGDLLCTDDVDYQSFRETTRDPSWRKEFLNKPISERKKIAKELRTISKEATGRKKEDICVSEVESISTAPITASSASASCGSNLSAYNSKNYPQDFFSSTISSVSESCSDSA